MRSYARELAVEIRNLEKYRDTLPEDFADQVFQSSPMHDIGKVGIPDAILLKPGKLSQQEFAIMKTHAQIGGDTLRAADIEAGQESFLAMGRDTAFDPDVVDAFFAREETVLAIREQFQDHSPATHVHCLDRMLEKLTEEQQPVAS